MLDEKVDYITPISYRIVKAFQDAGVAPSICIPGASGVLG
jgi:hypothetical protein